MIHPTLLVLVALAAPATSPPGERDSTPQLGYTPALLTTDAGARLASVEGIRATAGPLGIWALQGGVALPGPRAFGDRFEWEARAAFATGGASLNFDLAIPDSLGGSAWDISLWDVHVAGTAKWRAIRTPIVDLLLYAGPSVTFGQVSTTNSLGTGRVPHLGVGGIAGATLGVTLGSRVVLSGYGGMRAQVLLLALHDVNDNADLVRVGTTSPELGGNLAVRLTDTLSLDLATVVSWMDALGGSDKRDLVNVYNLGFSWNIFGGTARTSSQGGDDAPATL